MKKCFKCGEIKELVDFYKHPQMKDGHLNKCKVCTRWDVANCKSVDRRCVTCDRHFTASLYETRRRGGSAKNCSRECYYKYLPNLLEDKFSGYKMKYASVHSWIKRKQGKANCCWTCGRNDAETNYDWSNKSGEYLRSEDDWQMLCRSCHIRYDDMPAKRKATMIQRYGSLNTRSRNEKGQFAAA